MLPSTEEILPCDPPQDNGRKQKSQASNRFRPLTRPISSYHADSLVSTGRQAAFSQANRHEPGDTSSAGTDARATRAVRMSVPAHACSMGVCAMEQGLPSPPHAGYNGFQQKQAKGAPE